MNRSILLILGIVLTTVSIGPAQCATTKRPAQRPATATAPSKQVVRVDAPQLVFPTGVQMLDEINLDQQNLLGMIKQALPAFNRGLGEARGDVGAFARAMSFGDLADCIQGLTALRVVHFRANQPTESAALLPAFEAQLPESKGWKRIVYSSEMMKPAIVTAYSQEGKAFLGIMLNGQGDSFYVSTQGFVDLGKLATWTGGFLKVIGTHETPRAVPEAPPAPK